MFKTSSLCSKNVLKYLPQDSVLGLTIGKRNLACSLLQVNNAKTALPFSLKL